MPAVNINISASNNPRVQAAYGKYLGLDRDATDGEIKSAVIRSIVKITRDQEILVSKAEVDEDYTPINPT